MPATVALVRCGRYDATEVYDAVGRGLELLGGAERFARRCERIVLKPNLLASAAPDDCVTTHPTVFSAVARHLAEAGAELSWGDSPGFGRLEAVARKAGILAAADEIGIRMADFVDGHDVAVPEPDLIRTFFIANGVLESDGLVSLPKLKAHQLTRITGAVKNQFGCIPGLRKGEFHVRMDDIDRFSRMLVDLNRLVRPRLYVLDGVVAMEGNGPRSGDAKPMNVIALSDDPIALDATICRMVGLDPDLVGTIVHGERTGLGTTEVRYVGDALEDFVDTGFVVNRLPGSTTGNAGMRIVRNLVVPRPFIVEARCTLCGTCVEVCPVEPKAVDWRGTGRSDDEPPRHDYSRCIRCYCCQELCPSHAIEVERPPLRRFLDRFTGT